MPRGRQTYEGHYLIEHSQMEQTGGCMSQQNAIRKKAEKTKLKDWLCGREGSVARPAGHAGGGRALLEEGGSGRRHLLPCSEALAETNANLSWSVSLMYVKARKDASFSLSREVECYTTVLPAVPAPQTKLNPKHNGPGSNAFTHQRHNSIRCCHWHGILNRVYIE